MDAQTIADALSSILKQWGADLVFLVDKVYDGASVMSSSTGKNSESVSKCCTLSITCF